MGHYIALGALWVCAEIVVRCPSSLSPCLSAVEGNHTLTLQTDETLTVGCLALFARERKRILYRPLLIFAHMSRRPHFVEWHLNLDGHIAQDTQERLDAFLGDFVDGGFLDGAADLDVDALSWFQSLVQVAFSHGG